MKHGCVAPEPTAEPMPLAFDAAEWFHDPVFAGHLSRRHWRRLPSRAPVALALAADLCARHGASATFFVLGATAERYPELLRDLARAGHEIASAGHEPQALGEVPPGERAGVLQAWARARQAIEAATGQRVRGFRAAWPARGGDPWWREPLAAAGYDYDASECDAGLARGARAPCEVRVQPFAGSGLVALCLPASALDEAQPRLVGLPRAVRRAHAEGLDGALARGDALLQGRRLTSIAGTLGLPALPVTMAMPKVRSAAAAAPAAGVPRLAIVVPMKDEEEGVPSLLGELDMLADRLRACAACEFVFVDDGSVDRTWPLLQERMGGRQGVRLVRHPANVGVAAAIRSGLLATDAPFVASIDADLSYDPMEIGPMLRLLEGADLVTASPYHPQGSVRNVPWWRLLLSRTLSGCYRVLLRSPVHTWTSCFRLYRRSAVADLPLDNPGFLGTAEWMVRVLRRGGRVLEHPCQLEARLFGVSKMRVLRTIAGHLRLLWGVLRGRVN